MVLEHNIPKSRREFIVALPHASYRHTPKFLLETI